MAYVPAPIYDRKTAARRFDTIHAILRPLSVAQSLIEDRNEPIWRIGNRGVNELQTSCRFIRKFDRSPSSKPLVTARAETFELEDMIKSGLSYLPKLMYFSRVIFPQIAAKMTLLIRFCSAASDRCDPKTQPKEKNEMED